MDYTRQGWSHPCYWARAESQANAGCLPHPILINTISGFKFWAKHRFMSGWTARAAPYHDWLGKDPVRTDRGQRQAKELPWGGRGLRGRAARGGAGAAAQGPVDQGLLPLGVFLQWLWKKTQTFVTHLSVFPTGQWVICIGGRAPSKARTFYHRVINNYTLSGDGQIIYSSETTCSSLSDQQSSYSITVLWGTLLSVQFKTGLQLKANQGLKANSE